MNKYLLLGIIFLLFFLSGATYAAYRFYQKFLHEKQQKQQVELLISDKLHEIEVYKNKNGILVSENEALQLDNKTVKELINNGKLSWIKELEGVKKNDKNLEFAYKVQLDINDSLRSHLDFVNKNYINKKGDTTKFSAFKWGKIDKFGYDSLIQITPDSVFFKELEKVTLSGAMYWERKHPVLWVFSKKEYKSEIFSDNPNVKINELINIKVIKKK